MQLFDLSGVLSVVRACAEASRSSDKDEVVGETERNKFKIVLQSYDPMLLDVGLSGCRVTLEKTVALLNNNECKWGWLAHAFDELNGRLVDETSDKTFFSMTLRDAEFYEKPLKGWEHTIERFPSILDDVEESSKCFGLSATRRLCFIVFRPLKQG